MAANDTPARTRRQPSRPPDRGVVTSIAATRSYLLSGQARPHNRPRGNDVDADLDSGDRRHRHPRPTGRGAAAGRWPRGARAQPQGAVAGRHRNWLGGGESAHRRRYRRGAGRRGRDHPLRDRTPRRRRRGPQPIRRRPTRRLAAPGIHLDRRRRPHTAYRWATTRPSCRSSDSSSTPGCPTRSCAPPSSTPCSYGCSPRSAPCRC